MTDITTSDLPKDIGARMLADRTARGLSRAKYVEILGGLSISKISSIEMGRDPKPDEIPFIAHLAFVDPVASFIGEPDPVDAAKLRARGPQVPLPTGQLPTPAAAEAVAIDANPPIVEGESEHGVIAVVDAPVSDYELDYNNRQSEMLSLFAETVARLGGKPSAVPYHQTWGEPSSALPSMWPSIVTWCHDVNKWLDGLITTEEAAQLTAHTVTEEELRVQLQASSENIGLVEVAPAAETISLAELAVDALAFPDDGIRRVSNGQLCTFKRCRRKYWLTYYRKLGLASEPVTGAAPLGTRVHRCLAVYYVPDGQERGDPLAELERTYQEDLIKLAEDEFKQADLTKEVDLARAMLEGYLEWLAETGADEGLKVIAPETKVEVDARMPQGGVHLIAKLDIRADRTFGAGTTRVFVDHKTCGDFASITKMLAFDEQALHYDLCEFLNFLDSGMSAGEAEAVRSDGALYNLLRKSKRTERAKPPFYERVEVRHNIHTIRSYWLRVQGTVNEIIELERKLDAGMDHRQVAYPSPDATCSWQCEYFHVCPAMDDGSRAEDLLSAYFVTIDPLRRYANTSEGQTL